MPSEKAVPLSFRVTSTLGWLLEAAAERESRGLAKALEALLFAHCKQHDIVTKPAAAKRQGEEVE